MEEEKKRLFIPAILIVLIGLAIYANSMTGSFMWDDKSLVYDNVYIKSPANIANIFMENIEKGAGGESCAYRPIQILSYMFDYIFWRLKPAGFHLTNIILHILVALLLYQLISMLFNKSSLALITALLFVSHPIHTEAVTYISGRADPLAAVFMLLCLIFYIKNIHKDNPGLILLSLLTYALAILSREHTIILPVLILLYHYCFKIKIKPKQFIPISLMSAAYIILRLTLLRYLLPHLNQESTLLQRIPGVFIAIYEYIRLLILPFGLHMEYGNKIFGLMHPKIWLGLIIAISLITYGIRKKNTLLSFGILWFFIMLLPSSNLYPINAYMAEHWLYMPSIGFFLIKANLLNTLYERPKLKTRAIVIIACILIFYSSLTIRQNTFWQDSLKFYERTLKYASDSARVYNNIGYSYYMKDEFDKAIRMCKRSIEIDSTYAKAYYNLGLAYYALGKYDEAEVSYNKALEIDPNYEEAYNNLGIVYSRTGRIDEAIALYNKSISLNNKYPNPYNNLGNTYGIMGRLDDAIASFRKAIEINPDYGSSYFNLGVTYFHKKEYDLAIKYCDKALVLGYKADPGFLKLLEPYREKKQ